MTDGLQVPMMMDEVQVTVEDILDVLHVAFWGFIGECIGSMAHLPCCSVHTTSVNTCLFLILFLICVDVVFTNIVPPYRYKLMRLLVEHLSFLFLCGCAVFVFCIMCMQ